MDNTLWLIGFGSSNRRCRIWNYRPVDPGIREKTKVRRLCENSWNEKLLESVELRVDRKNKLLKRSGVTGFPAAREICLDQPFERSNLSQNETIKPTTFYFPSTPSLSSATSPARPNIVSLVFNLALDLPTIRR